MYLRLDVDLGLFSNAPTGDTFPDCLLILERVISFTASFKFRLSLVDGHHPLMGEPADRLFDSPLVTGTAIKLVLLTRNLVIPSSSRSVITVVTVLNRLVYS